MKQEDRKGGQIYELLFLLPLSQQSVSHRATFLPSDPSQTLAAHVSYQATAPFQPWAPPRESGSTNPGVSPRFCSPFLFHGLEGPRTLPHPCAAHTQTHYLPSKPLPPHPKVFSWTSEERLDYGGGSWRLFLGHGPLLQNRKPRRGCPVGGETP